MVRASNRASTWMSPQQTVCPKCQGETYLEAEKRGGEEGREKEKKAISTQTQAQPILGGNENTIKGCDSKEGDSVMTFGAVLLRQPERL